MKRESRRNEDADDDNNVDESTAMSTKKYTKLIKIGNNKEKFNNFRHA